MNETNISIFNYHTKYKKYFNLLKQPTYNLKLDISIDSIVFHLTRPGIKYKRAKANLLDDLIEINRRKATNI